MSFNYGRIAEFTNQRYKKQQTKVTERLPLQSVPLPPEKPTKRRKTIRCRDRDRDRDREGVSNYKRNYVRRERYVLPLRD